MAARAAGPAPDERAVRPGMEGGAFAPLTESDMQRVYDTALELIDEVGMGDPIPEFVEAVTEAGGRMDDGGRLHYPRAVVESLVLSYRI